MPGLEHRILQQRYQVLRKIGEGGMGEVYLAVPPGQVEPRYAIKVLKQNLSHTAAIGQRFRDEADVLKRLEHPAILKFHEYFDDHGALCMVLDYVDGESLAERLQRTGAMGVGTALPIFEGVLAALDFAHRAGVIHRDVKPSNVLIDRASLPQLCDFGIARQVGQRGLTGTGMTLGTPHYMSPEQIQTPQSIDHRSDLYSAGVLLYEMLTGKVPFGNVPTESDFAILQQQVHAEPPDPRRFKPELDDALCRVLKKALRKDPERRYQGGREFWEALERATQRTPSGRPGPARTPGDLMPVASLSEQVGGGRSYAVYRHPHRRTVAIKQGFCWPALCIGPLWLFFRGLIGRALLWFVGFVVLCAMLLGIATQPDDGPRAVLVVLLCVVALAFWWLPAYRGNLWREAKLARKGYVRVGEVPARSAAAAVVAAAASRVQE